jgi:tripartite ATP-independent transporter DctM subunit
MWTATLAAASLAFVPVINLVLARVFWSGLPEASTLAKQSLIALTFLAAAATSMQGKHLSLGAVPAEGSRLAGLAGVARTAALTSIDTMMLMASLSLLLIGFEPDDRVFGIPIAVVASPMAFGFVFMVCSDFLQGKGRERIAAAAGLLVGLFLSAGAISNILSVFNLYPESISTLAGLAGTFTGFALWPLIIVLVILAFAGLPLYAVISGAAALLYLASGSSIELIPSEAYNLFRNDSMPAIPLFTLAGFILSESGAGKRLVDLFREWFGWMPGGEAFAAVLVCAFFTTFTGANGVAILALGGILATVLIESGSYDEDFTHGFLTASSSVGLLFPPSMAVIVYAVNATFIVQGESAFSIGDMFLGGLLPGVMIVLAMAAMGTARSVKKIKLNDSKRRRFSLARAGRALRKSLPEIAIPLIILVLYLTGFASLTEIGAIVVLYVIIVEGPIRRDLGNEGIFVAVAKALPIAGGALIIIAAARGLSFYTMEAGLPELFSSWMTSVVSSRFVFLLLLNLALLLVGCFMDIFSAVLIISPLVIPLGSAYGVHPVHLGVIFIMNLSIGFLTPPIGMNLFLASYAFNKPVIKIFRNVLPFFVVQLVILALVTWVPWFSLAFLPGIAR